MFVQHSWYHNTTLSYVQWIEVYIMDTIRNIQMSLYYHFLSYLASKYKPEEKFFFFQDEDMISTILILIFDEYYVFKYNLCLAPEIIKFQLLIFSCTHFFYFRMALLLQMKRCRLLQKTRNTKPTARLFLAFYFLYCFSINLIGVILDRCSYSYFLTLLIYKDAWNF